MKKIPPPDLRVIDEAIEFISRGVQQYSCVALGSAYRRATGEDDWVTIHRYTDQYRRYTLMRNRGFQPIWWNSPLHGKEWRIEALKAFRQACVRAGQKEAA